MWVLESKTVRRILDQLWSKYYDSDHRKIKPPTLDRATRRLREEGAVGTYPVLRRAVKKILMSGDFICTREKDNCGISWLCFCHVNSEHLTTCINSKNRVKEQKNE